MSHNQNRAARSAKMALVFVGHAALFTAAVIVTVVVLTSRRKPAPKATAKEDKNDNP